MKKHYPLLGSLTIFLAVLLVFSAHAYAQDSSQFDQQIQAIHEHRAQMEDQLGIDPTADTYPHATCYYDDLVDHYEHDQIMRDFLDEDII